MVIPECPYPLLGRDLLSKVGAHLHFEGDSVSVNNQSGAPVSILTLSLNDEHRLYTSLRREKDNYELLHKWLKEIPEVWAKIGGIGWAKHRAWIVVQLKATATPVHVRQYPIPQEAKVGIVLHI